jgi:hypothetical protein
VSPAARAVIGAWCRRRGLWISVLVCAFLALVMARAVREVGGQLTESTSINGMVFQYLIAVLIGVQWSAFLTGEALALVPGHERLHRLVVLGCLVPLLAAFSFAMFLIGHQTPLHAFSGAVIGLHGLYFFRSLSLPMASAIRLILAVLGPILVWQVTCEAGSWQVVFDSGLLLLSAGFWRAVWHDRVAWLNPLSRHPLSLLEMSWPSSWARGRIFRASGTLSAARAHIEAWTTPGMPIGLFGLGAIAGLLASVIDRRSTVLLAVLLTAGWSVPLVLSLVVATCLTSRHLAMERLRGFHRTAVASALLLGLAGRHLILAGSGLAGVLLGWVGWQLIVGGAPPEIPWWGAPALALLGVVSVAFLSMANLIVMQIQFVAAMMLTFAFLSVVANEEARQHVEVALAGHPGAVLLGLAGVAVVILPIAWYRLANVELP